MAHEQRYRPAYSFGGHLHGVVVLEARGEVMYVLFDRNRKESEHHTLEDAEAGARWRYFELVGTPWEGNDRPPGFLILWKGYV